MKNIRWLLFFFSSVFLSAQSNELVDVLIAEEQATIENTVHIVMHAAGIITDNETSEEALGIAVNRNYLPSVVKLDETITFGQFSHLLMQAFNEKGGLLYTLFPTPRYAAREVLFRNWSRNRFENTEKISGNDVMRILSVYLNKKS